MAALARSAAAAAPTAAPTAATNAAPAVAHAAIPATTAAPSLAVPGPVTPAAPPPCLPRLPLPRVRESPTLLPLDFDMDLALPPFPDVWPARPTPSPHPLEAVSPESPQQPELWDGVDKNGDTTLTDVGPDCIVVCEKCAMCGFYADA